MHGYCRTFETRKDRTETGHGHRGGPSQETRIAHWCRGSVACWGHDKYGEDKPPAGEFISVGAGDNHTCGVRAVGTVVCLGDDDYGRATPPEGDFTSISTGGMLATSKSETLREPRDQGLF